MADRRLRAVIESVYRDRGTKTAARDFRNLADEAERGGRSLRGAGQASQQSGRNLKSLATAAVAVGAALGGIAFAAKKGYDALKEGAALELAASRFEKLAATIGATSDALLTDLQQATSGMISNAELMATATDIISLGLADSQEGVVRLARVVGELGLDMQQVIMTFANDSVMRLDALGLSVEGVTQRAEELEAAGMAATLAFDQAVLEGLEDRLELVGSAAGTTTGDLQVLASVGTNRMNALKQGIANATTPIIGYFASIVVAAEEASRAISQALVLDQRYQLVQGLQATEVGTGAELTQWVTGQRPGQLGARQLGIEGLATMAVNARQFSSDMVQAFGSAEEAVDAYIATLQRIDANQLIGLMAFTPGQGVTPDLDTIYEYINAIKEATAADEAMRNSNAAVQLFDDTQAAAEGADDVMLQYQNTVEGVDKAVTGASLSNEEFMASTVNMASAMQNYVPSAEAAAAADEERLERIKDTLIAERDAQQAVEDHVAAVNALTVAQRASFSGDFVSTLQSGADGTTNWTNELLLLADQMGLTTGELALLAGATGEYTDAQIEAAVKAAAMAAKVREVAAAVAAGEMTIADAIAALENFEEQLAHDYTMVVGEQGIDETLSGLDAILASLGLIDDYVATATINYVGGQVAIDNEPVTIPGTGGKGFKQHGGPVSGGHPYVVGETGPELFIPYGHGSIMSNSNMMAMSPSAMTGAGGGVTVIDNSRIIVTTSREATALALASADTQRRERLNGYMGVN